MTGSSTDARGYRAQFWIDPVVGIDFNTRAVASMSEAILARVPDEVPARRIVVHVEGASRDEEDTGEIILTRTQIRNSLLPEASKVWIGERLYSSCEPVRNIGLPLLLAAERGEKLNIPRWADAVNPVTGAKGEGLRAPLPVPEEGMARSKGRLSES
jgi:hypothetical protein